MFGIYVYECGLKFTGKIASTKASAEKYLSNKYGRVEQVFTGKFDVNGCPIYTNAFVPSYNKDAFVIKALEMVE